MYKKTVYLNLLIFIVIMTHMFPFYVQMSQFYILQFSRLNPNLLSILPIFKKLLYLLGCDWEGQW